MREIELSYIPGQQFNGAFDGSYVSKSHSRQETEGFACAFFSASLLNMIHIGNIIHKAFSPFWGNKITAESLLKGNNLLRNRSRYCLKIMLVGIKEEMRLK